MGTVDFGFDHDAAVPQDGVLLGRHAHRGRRLGRIGSSARGVEEGHDPFVLARLDLDVAGSLEHVSAALDRLLREGLNRRGRDGGRRPVVVGAHRGGVLTMSLGLP